MSFLITIVNMCGLLTPTSVFALKYRSARNGSEQYTGLFDLEVEEDGSVVTADGVKGLMPNNWHGQAQQRRVPGAVDIGESADGEGAFVITASSSLEETMIPVEASPVEMHEDALQHELLEMTASYNKKLAASAKLRTMKAPASNFTTNDETEAVDVAFLSGSFSGAVVMLAAVVSMLLVMWNQAVVAVHTIAQSRTKSLV